MTTSIPIRRESLHRQMEIHRNNLAALEEQAANYGLRVPVDMHNEIEYARTQIRNLEQMLAAASADGDTLDVGIDNGLDTLLRAMSVIQTRMDGLMKAYLLDHSRVAVLWQRAHPSAKHRLSIAVAIAFLVAGASLVFIKESRDLLFGSAFWLGMVVVATIWLCAPLIYVFGRDDYHGDE